MKATIGLCTLTLDLGGVDSLKLKRSILKSLFSKLRAEFNIAVAEIADQDELELAIVAFATISNSASHANSMVNNIINWIEGNWNDGEISDQQIEIL
jgi:uncharacterized protein